MMTAAVAVLFLAAVPYIGCVYGWTEAGGAALILLLPVYVGLRMYFRRQPIQELELGYALAAVITAAGGVVVLMGSWESGGVRYRHRGSRRA
jgi:hypothetical protein